MTLNDAERLLDSGKLQMRRPWGDYVPIRRRRATKMRGSGRAMIIPVFMEMEVKPTSPRRACGSTS